MSGSVSSDASEYSTASSKELRKYELSCLSCSGLKRAKDRYQRIDATCAQHPITLAPAGHVQYQPKMSLAEYCIHTSYEVEFL